MNEWIMSATTKLHIFAAAVMLGMPLAMSGELQRHSQGMMLD